MSGKQLRYLKNALYVAITFTCDKNKKGNTMNKLIITASAVIASPCCLAFADEREGMYVGMQYGFSTFIPDDDHHKNYDNDDSILGAFAGYHFNDDVSIELGYSENAEARKNVGAVDYGLTVKSLYLDALTRMYINENSNLIFSAGVNRLELETNEDNGSIISSKNTNDIGIRFGIGFERRFNERISAKANVNYTGTDLYGYNQLMQYTAGVSYDF